MDQKLTIGRVAKRAGVNIQTVRYYERRGILSPNGYRDSGYRLYDDEAVHKLLFIKNAQDLGFSLKEISELLRLRVSDSARCGDVKKRAEAKLKDIHGRMACLRALEAALKDLLRACRNRSKTDSCPILRSLEMRRGELRKRYAVKIRSGWKGRKHWRQP
jgi:MerR family mercuric resistance operon transcriptional regulator/MerR family gold-responsive transcriptional activator of gol and ges genes